jgi:hypothetical protein
MREINSNDDAQLAALNEINHSLRQQIIELSLSIAAMRETADITGGIRGAHRDRDQITGSFGSSKSATVLRMRGR